MYYKIKNNFALRGWQKLPYAVCDMDKGSTMFINEAEFQALSLCNGQVPFDAFYVLPEFKEIIKKAEERGFVEPISESSPLLPWQNYRLHDSRYMGTAHWSITGRCNYKCRHCYMSAPDAKFGELSHARCLDIIDQLQSCGIRRVTVTGGEALVRSDFWELVDRMLAYGMHIDTVYSNGRLVNEKTLSAFEKRRIRPEFNLSFDGVGWHDWLRGIDGAEQEAIAAFKLCGERGFPTGAEMCLHRRNKHTLRETINLLASLGVAHIKTNPASLSGEWIKNAGDDHLPQEELYDVYLDYIPYFFKDNMPMTVHLGGFFMGRKGSASYMLPFVKGNGAEAAGRRTVCDHARHHMYISAEGRVLPCMSLSGLEIQNDFPLITETPLSECLTDSSYMRLIGTTVNSYIDENAECASCEHKYYCCAGCRASALNTGSELMGPDNASCLLFKGGYIPLIIKAASGGECANCSL